MSAEAGLLAENVVRFARLLRAAGLPIGPGAGLDAVRAVEAAGFSQRADFRVALHATLVKRREHTAVFDAAFDAFWRRRDPLAANAAAATAQNGARPKAAASRVAQAMAPPQRVEATRVERDMRLAMSPDEALAKKDFAQMSADEIARARAAIDAMDAAQERLRSRRLVPRAHGARIDPRRSFRRSLRAGGAGIDLAFRARAERHPPIVALCDISGSMSDYTRVFLHFLHALMEKRGRVHVFLFGTRLTNITRALARKDPDEALAACAASVEDWSGGTRIAASLHAFNRLWARRVLGQGATLLLFTDGLERDGGADLAREMDRLHKSSRRFIWLNPLLRFDRFEAKAQGVRTMLPFVDEFRPIHNLDSVADLTRTLGGEAGRLRSPRDWLR